jgi:hypothetical protein
MAIETAIKKFINNLFDKNSFVPVNSRSLFDSEYEEYLIHISIVDYENLIDFFKLNKEK